MNYSRLHHVIRFSGKQNVFYLVVYSFLLVVNSAFPYGIPEKRSFFPETGGKTQAFGHAGEDRDNLFLLFFAQY